MALETIKLIVSGSVDLVDAPDLSHSVKANGIRQHSLLMLSASGTSPSVFRSIRLKGKRADCVSCGHDSSITRDTVLNGSLDYTVFCGAANPVIVLTERERITASELQSVLSRGEIVLQNAILFTSEETSSIRDAFHVLNMLLEDVAQVLPPVRIERSVTSEPPLEELKESSRLKGRIDEMMHEIQDSSPLNQQTSQHAKDKSYHYQGQVLGDGEPDQVGHTDSSPPAPAP